MPLPQRNCRLRAPARQRGVAVLGWSGSPTHLVSVREQLGRVQSGQVEYLAACLPSGAPVGKMQVDYARQAGAGTLCQAAVHPVLQPCGIGALQAPDE
jgi:hypothetical protein